MPFSSQPSEVVAEVSLVRKELITPSKSQLALCELLQLLRKVYRGGATSDIERVPRGAVLGDAYTLPVIAQ